MDEMDRHDKNTRSYNMSRIRSKNTKPEILLQNFLNDLKINFIPHSDSIKGKPDIFIPTLNLIIEVYGCFWHGHKHCRYFVIPKSNQEFWLGKIESNIRRDKKNVCSFKSDGFKVLIIWECEIKNGRFLDKLFKHL